MPYVPFMPIPPQLQDSSSLNLNGGSLEFFLAGTSTPTNIFSDDTGTVIGTTVSLNASGYPSSGGNVVTLFRDVDIDYKVVLKSAADATLWTSDDIDMINAADIPIVDSGGNFSATDVEAALLEAKGTTLIKTANESRASDTTLADDTHLQGFSLTTGSHYALFGMISYTLNVGDLKFTFDFSNTPSPSYGIYIASDESAVLAASAMSALTGTYSITTLTDGDDCAISFSCGFQANAGTGGTLDFQWAQNTSSANNTTVREGSWLRLIQIN